MNIAFLPVRGQSKSIPLKNIKDFCGQPLIFWALNSLEQSKIIDKIVVATDSPEIEIVATSFGFSKVEIYRRNIENAQDHSTTESVIFEYLNFSPHDSEDWFFLVQATSPFIQPDDFESAFDQLISENADSLLTGAVAKRFFWDFEGNPLNYDPAKRPRRQDFKGFLIENGSFYISRIESIHRENCRISGKKSIYVMPEFTSIELDEEDDWFLAEFYMKKYILKNNNLNEIKLFMTDVDGVLTDAGMYYSENGDELKKFNTQDGKGIELLRKKGLKTAIVTSETTDIVSNRAKKLQIDYVYQGIHDKLKIAKELCERENISLSQVAYIGDDINCLELLSNCGMAACPSNALEKIKAIPNILKLKKRGGEGCVREFAEYILSSDENS